MNFFKKIELDNDFAISIIQYDNLYANSFRQFNTWKWSDWLNKLQIPMNNSDKYKRGLVLYGDVEDEVKDDETIPKYRKDDNIINRSVIALDYDEIREQDFKSLHKAISKQLEGHSWSFHTTHSHTTEKPRIRLMVPLNEPVSADDYRKYSRALANHIGHKVDEASFVPSQAMALPVKNDKDAVYIFRYNDAPAITIEELVKMSRNLDNSQKDNPITTNYSNQYKKRDSSYWRNIAFGVGEGERNQVLASLIGYLLRRYVDTNLIYGLVSAWAQMCQPPLEQGEVNKTFKSILKKDSKSN
ncbi:primase alpha helix C-terminal domain-containing protein [Staphylococcus saprophyticus]|uniref:primase alpha helix C-terminal domain-containing protein n=2 Tax=Staphylococcus TaxID=1279 RepID=UPI000853359D|nr:primase alpha helix C-terminal domain-containing protein [Staphylococcus saprophyticus]MBN6754431.1 primase alpha helix C-terminal domain-containing protein [Staphylococcus saprophyticus]MBN6764412.1 primase alpha helix C-terminal domain-containing protein [Staphylococcus saprophyticus]MBN6769215.1 primase alpha helix C-terminal domain-containing protein [Staphylococcus saprophyticus]MBN6780940.1 primase alpha helix C-terminal domain-containing protein [Staphylococcus saprophyticus]MBN67861